MINIKIFVITVLLVVMVEARSYRGFARSQPLVASYSAPSASRSARQTEPEPSPEPYSFTYETTDEYGMTLSRTESGDAQGNVKGSYMYRDPEGVYRTVEYGDSGDGFSAQIQTNEPGVISHKAADAEYFKQ
ncbi:cuticle protein 10.9-like [Dermatophagoides pteronyssinus]|uniref:Cuticle protein 10.9-like n=1 Tax=Dermatophagoides pteronyssinus TaxID=6956 RepID=A0A6P6YHP3_DERPT|nr:cuticle protein 10.9-like [Dermatophagoides pteronyssinus]